MTERRAEAQEEWGIMATNEHEYTFRRFGKNVTMSVKISTEFRVRKWIALHLIKLAVNILGAKFEIEVDE